MVEAVIHIPFTAILSDFDPGIAVELEVEVYDPITGVTHLAASGDGIEESKPGTYRVERTATEAGKYLIRWTRPGAADPDDLVVVEEDLEVAGEWVPEATVGYPPVGYFVNQSSGEVRDLLDALDADQLDAVYEMAIADVERYCQQSFRSASVKTHVLDGSGSSSLELPERLIELTGLVVDSTLLGPSDATLDARGGALALATSGGNYYTRALRELSGGDLRTFPVGGRNVSITGLWGWEAVPTRVLAAIRLTIEDIVLADQNELATTIRAYRRLGIASISQGPLRTELAPTAPLSPRAMDLLDGYVWESAVGALI